MKRPIVWATLFTICGIYMRLGISEMVCLVSFSFILLTTSRFVMKERSAKYLILLLFTVLGFVLAGYHWQSETAEISMNGRLEGTGVVKEAGVTSSGNQKLTILCDLQDAEGNSLQDVKLYAIWSKEGRFEAGDAVGFLGELVPFYKQSYPGGYDEELFLKTKGYDCKMYPEEMWYTGEEVSFSSVMAKGRARVHASLDRILPAEESGIMKAMLTGERDDIPENGYEIYTRAGVVHVLCISGLHMSCLALYVSFFMEKILKRSRRVSAVVTMLAAISFLAFTGATPSSVRAVTMICVVMTGRVIFRLHDRLNEIAIAALLILLIQPLYLFHIGFQLSFVTVIGLCLAAERIERKKQKDRTPFDWLKESLLFSLYASLFSYPIVAYYFSYISTVGILANLVIIPLSGLLLGFGILSAVIGMIWVPAGVFAAGSVYLILQVFKITCTILLELPLSYALVGRPSDLVILLYYAVLFFYMKFGARKGSWKVTVALCAALWCAVFENALFHKENTVAFLDVGQGDAAVVSTYDGKTYLMDGGGQYGKELGENTGTKILLPYLEYLGEDQLDGMFISHPDSDHMTGLLEIMEVMPVKSVYISDYKFQETKELLLLKETIAKRQLSLYTIKIGDKSAEGNWECLYPLKGIVFSDGDDNHGSAVLKYTYGGTDILFTGDIAEQDEQLLLQKGADVSADILKVSHHGSKYSSSREFLAAVNAKTVMISCGENNIYGHPHQDALERLEMVGADIHRTDLEGSILVTLSPDGTYEIETMAERKPFYERIKKAVEEW